MTGNEAIFLTSRSHPPQMSGKQRTRQRRKKPWSMVRQQFWLSQSCVSPRTKLKMMKKLKKRQSDQISIKTQVCSTDQNFFSAITVN